MDPTLETEPLTHEFHNCGRGPRGHHLVSLSLRGSKEGDVLKLGFLVNFYPACGVPGVVEP